MIGKIMFTIFVILGVALAVVLIKRQNFINHLDKLDAEIKHSSEPSFPRTDLPPVVMAYLSRVGVGQHDVSKYVTFDQVVQMWSAPGAKPMDMTAKQIISTNETEFVWRALSGFADSILIADYFVKSVGGMEVKVLGTITMANMVGGDSAAKGEALRFLAELPLNPDAMLFNTSLEWTAVDPKTFKVATGQGRARGEITFKLGDDGFIATASAPSRSYGTTAANMTEHPWHGRFWDYQTVQGRTVPMQAEIAWGLETGDFIYWRGKMLNWKAHAY